MRVKAGSEAWNNPLGDMLVHPLSGLDSRESRRFVDVVEQIDCSDIASSADDIRTLD